MLGILIIFGLILYYFYYHLVEKRNNLPPGPTPLPIVGNILQIDMTAPHKTFAQWAQKYGPVYTVWLGPEANIFVTDYQLLKDSFIKQGDTYAGRPRNFVFEAFTGGQYGMVITEGQFWREQRRFSLHVLRDFGFGRNLMEEKIMKQVDTMVDQIGEHVGKTVSLKHELELCVGNVINSVLFGYSYKKGDPEFLKLKKLLDDNIQLLGKPEVFMLAAYPWLRYVPLFGNFGYKVLIEHVKIFVGFLEEQVERHKESFDQCSDSDEPPSDYTSAFRKELLRRQHSNEDMGSFSEWQLKMAIGDIWAAGMETTVTTLKWGVLYMVHYPEVQEKCWREIQNLLAGRQEAQLKIQMADKSLLPYTAATLNEVQRLANLLPFNLPHSVTQDTVLDGHVMEQGTIVVPQISVVMTDPKVFPNPDKFQPERFLEDDGKTLKKVEELVPFSVGKRMCLGESLARMELFLIFATLVQNFKFAPKPNHPPPTLQARPGFTHAPIEYEVFVERRILE